MENIVSTFCIIIFWGMFLFRKLISEILTDLYRKTKFKKINIAPERTLFQSQTTTTMSNKIEAFLQSKELHFSTIENTDTRTVFRFGVSLETGNFDINIYNLKERNIVFMQVVASAIIPENKRTKAAEYFIRINDDRLVGSFDMNYNEGNFKYSSSFFYDENETDFSMNLNRNYYAIINSMNDYFAGLMKVIYGNNNPVDVICEINEQPNPILN